MPADYEYQQKELSRATSLELAVRKEIRAEAELHRGICLHRNYCPFASDCPELVAYKKTQTIQRQGLAPPPKTALPIPTHIPEQPYAEV